MCTLLIACAVIAAFIRNLRTSSPRHDLKKLTVKLRQHLDDFDRTAAQAERGRAIKADQHMQQGLNVLTGEASGSQSASSPLKFPVHLVNIAENPDSVGRKTQLEGLYKLLVVDHKEARPAACTLYGNPGVGKTQTALKFVYQYGGKFYAVFWVSADPAQGTETLRTFGNIGRRLGLFKNEEIDEGQVAIVLEWLQTAGMMTLVF